MSKFIPVTFYNSMTKTRGFYRIIFIFILTERVISIFAPHFRATFVIKLYLYIMLNTACGGMDNMCTVYDLNNRDSNGGAKMVRELLGYEGFLSSCRFVDDKTLITGSGDMKL